MWFHPYHISYGKYIALVICLIITVQGYYGNNLSLTNSQNHFPLSADPTIPDAPVVNIPIVQGDQINLTWNIPDTDGGSPIYQYNIYRANVTGQETFLQSCISLNFLDTPATSGTYYYYVTAVNAISESMPSNEVNIAFYPTPSPRKISRVY